ncbi:hypothetical protein V1477_001375 [Vespula maculifrons]|uniref:Uncharacterized protein n=1 Tax=Vespula maculifrons TaxID=7453 RepID=A0ABD2CZ45_VESMC
MQNKNPVIILVILNFLYYVPNQLMSKNIVHYSAKYLNFNYLLGLMKEKQMKELFPYYQHKPAVRRTHEHRTAYSIPTLD